MLPPRWTHPACMNMEVKSVRTSPKGLARKRRGTKAHVLINASPPLCSTKNNRTFRAIKAYVTRGTVLREVSSSPIGNIKRVSFFWLSPLHVRMSLAFFKESDLLRDQHVPATSGKAPNSSWSRRPVILAVNQLHRVHRSGREL